MHAPCYFGALFKPCSPLMNRDPLSRWLFGLLGGAGLFLLLPRAVRFVFKNFFFSILAEVVTVVIAGLLAEKAVDAAGETKAPSRIVKP